MVFVMEEIKNNRVSSFDAYYTNYHIQMLKIIYSVLPSDTQKILAVYIRFLELQCAYKYPVDNNSSNHFNILNLITDLQSDKQDEVISFLDELLPFSNSSEKERINSLKKTIYDLKQIQEMQNTLSMLKELFPEGFTAENSFDLFNMFSKEEK